MTAPENGLVGLLGIEGLEAEHGRARGEMVVRAEHLAVNGLVHAGAVVTFADTACGYGCLSSLPPHRTGFATAELTSHHIGSAKVGETLLVEAVMRHGGSTTQLWDATVRRRAADGSERDIATFRCLQILLAPRE